MKARNQIQSRWFHLGEGERWGRHGRTGSVWKARASVQSLPVRLAIHFTSRDKNQYKTVCGREGEPPWQFKKGSEVREGREEAGQWQGERGRGTWSGGGGCSDSTGAAEDEECCLFLPVQTSCSATSPSVVINTCYFPLSTFQSIDKTRVRPARTMALSSALSDVGWIATASMVGMVQEKLLGDMRDQRNSRRRWN